MDKRITKTEDKILQAANIVFLLYGYHGATLQQIALEADVNKASIHYYFRSKEMLYFNVVKNILNLFQDGEIQFITDKKRFEKSGWFLFTELYNNKELFLSKVKESNPDDWDKKINQIKKWLEFSYNESSMLSDTSD
jgi:AcrR family transcriptional regulator